MLDVATEALSFVRGRAKADLAVDRQFALALIKEIEIVGEAASKVSAETRARCADVPWAAIISTRNRLIHAYAEIDLEVVWSALTIDLPNRVRILEQILR
jgi:uncharacterized protein with HEPN domain